MNGRLFRLSSRQPYFMHSTSFPKRLALLHWGDVVEDITEPNGITLEAFCNEMTGGWQFNYIDALKQQGVETVIVLISDKKRQAFTTLHRPTGATIEVLPVPGLYRFFRRYMPDPYSPTAGRFRGYSLLKRWVLEGINDVMPYLSTPLSALRGVLQKHGCTAILCQEYEYGRFDACVLLGRWMKIPVYASFQGGDYQVSRLEKWSRPAALKRSGGLIIAPKKEGRRVLERYHLPTEKIARIFNPVDVHLNQAGDRAAARAQLGLPADATIVIFHGRINIRQKGLDNLVEAWKQLYREDKNLLLLLVGAGDDNVAFGKLIDGVPGILWVSQYINDRELLGRYLSAANLYVLPSRHEGFPVAPIEAMAHSLPIVAAAANGVEDILEEGEASGGIMVPKDRVDMLAEALQVLIDDEAKREQMGKLARKRVEAHFGLEVVGAQLKAFMFRDDSTN
jgi:starch synthase